MASMPTFVAVRRAVAVLALAGVAAACSGQSGGSGGSRDVEGQITGSGAGEVTVALPSDDPGDVKLRNEQAAAFMKQNPDIKVKMLTIPGDSYDDKVRTMIAGGKAPDLFASGDVQIPTIVRKRYAQNLTPTIQAESYDLSNFYPEVLKGLTFEDKLVGLTDNWDTQVLYYNKSLFDKHGVAYPTEDWTWEDFVAAARKLTSGSGTGKTYGAVYDAAWFAPVYDQIWSNGGDVISADGKTCQLNTPTAQQSIQSIADLFREGLAPSPSALDQPGSEASQLFLSGKAAMGIGVGGRWAAFDFQDVKAFDWRVAPLPKGSAGRANFFHLSMFSIAADAKNKAGAWKFLKFIVSPEGIRMGAESARGIPSRKALATDPVIAENELAKAHDAYQPFLDSLPTAHSAPYITEFGKVDDEISSGLDPVWSGRKRAAEVTGPICQAVDQLLAQGASR
jgi:multiple sugar transport system substrate-binding protein